MSFGICLGSKDGGASSLEPLSAGEAEQMEIMCSIVQGRIQNGCVGRVGANGSHHIVLYRHQSE